MSRKHNDTDMYTKLLIRWLMDPKLSSPLKQTSAQLSLGSAGIEIAQNTH